MEIKHDLPSQPRTMPVVTTLARNAKTAGPTTAIPHGSSPRFTPAGRAERMHSWNLRMQRLFAGQHY